jgi:hypothetical protein
MAMPSAGSIALLAVGEGAVLKDELSSARSEIARRAVDSPSPDPSCGQPDPSSGRHTPCASDSRSARWPRYAGMPRQSCCPARRHLDSTQLPDDLFPLVLLARHSSSRRSPDYHSRWTTQTGAVHSAIVDGAEEHHCLRSAAIGSGSIISVWIAADSMR